MNNVGAQAIRGGLLKLSAQAINFVVRIASMIVLARLLNPSDFGLVAMVTTVTGLLNVFRDFGLSAATVQQATVTQEQLSTIFWLNILLGMGLTLITVALGPVLVQFYNEPRLFWITVAVSAAYLASAIGMQHLARLQRQLRFFALASIDVLALVVSASIGIGMALSGLEYWAIVGMLVSSPMVYSLLAWSVGAWLPGAPRRNIGVSAMIRFGSTITLNSVIVYIAYNLDKFLIGRLWGPDALGIYSRAYQIINIPVDILNSAAYDVGFSGLARVRDQPEMFRRYFLSGYKLLIAATVPITFICAIFAQDIIPLLLGAKWIDSIPIFQLLAPTTLIFAMINPMAWFMFSLGLVGRSMKITLILAPVVILGFLIGLPYGAKGVALGFSVAMAIWVIPHIALCVRGTVVSLRDVLMVCVRPLFSASGAAVISVVFLYAIPSPISHLERLTFGIFVMLLSYILILLYVMGEKDFYITIVARLRQRFSSDR